MGVQSPKTNMLATVWALVNIEASSIIDKALNYFGEVTLHTVSAMGASFAINRYYRTLQESDGNKHTPTTPAEKAPVTEEL